MLASLIATALLTGTPVSVPWGKVETHDEKAALKKTRVCRDEKSHVVVSAPHERQSTQLYYGDGKTFFAVPSPPWVLSGDEFFEPRFFNATYNEDFRGVDMRLYSSVSVDEEKHTCTVHCGPRTTVLPMLSPEDAKALLLAATFERSPQEYQPHALLRDSTGRYYYVDQGMWPENEKAFRLFAGPKGNLKLQAMTDIVSDSEGQIFSTKDGQLRLLVDHSKSSQWIQRGKSVELRDVPVEKNMPLIYNELGVYTGLRRGTPCDDL